MRAIPSDMHWLFWETDPSVIDLEADADYVIARVLEFGRAREVRWLLAELGPERIHTLLRDVGHPELSARTLSFWRLLLNAKEEKWREPPSFRSSGPSWPS